MFDDVLPPTDRGLHYGDGLFETMAVEAGRIRLLERHMHRLAWGAERLAIPLPSQDALADNLHLAARALGEGILKLILTRGSGGRGYAPPAVAEPGLVLLRYPQALPALEPLPVGIRVRRCDLRLARQPRLAGIKHLNRLEYVLARAEWKDATLAEGLLWDCEGELIEATTSNVFLFHDGKLFTPMLDQCGVAGVMRAEVMACAGRLGMAVEEARLRLEDLLAADEVFLSNSLHGIRSVRALHGEREWPLGEIARALHSALRADLRVAL